MEEKISREDTGLRFPTATICWHQLPHESEIVPVQQKEGLGFLQAQLMKKSLVLAGLWLLFLFITQPEYQIKMVKNVEPAFTNKIRTHW